MTEYIMRHGKKLMKRDDVGHLTSLIDNRLNLLEDIIKHSGPSDACWVVDSKKISELESNIFELGTTANIEFSLRLEKIEKKLKDCYSYR